MATSGNGGQHVQDIDDDNGGQHVQAIDDDQDGQSYLADDSSTEDDQDGQCQLADGTLIDHETLLLLDDIRPLGCEECADWKLQVQGGFKYPAHSIKMCKSTLLSDAMESAEASGDQRHIVFVSDDFEPTEVRFVLEVLYDPEVSLIQARRLLKLDSDIANLRRAWELGEAFGVPVLIDGAERAIDKICVEWIMGLQHVMNIASPRNDLIRKILRGAAALWNTPHHWVRGQRSIMSVVCAATPYLRRDPNTFCGLLDDAPEFAIMFSKAVVGLPLVCEFVIGGKETKEFKCIGPDCHTTRTLDDDFEDDDYMDNFTDSDLILTPPNSGLRAAGSLLVCDQCAPKFARALGHTGDCQECGDLFVTPGPDEREDTGDGGDIMESIEYDDMGNDGVGREFTQLSLCESTTGDEQPSQPATI